MSELRVFDIQRFAIHDGPGIRTAVFFKGCPLHCPWCANPESQLAGPQLLWEKSRCVNCGRCAAACPRGAVTRTADGPQVDRARCQACGSCVKACHSKALRICGQVMEPSDVLKVALRDRAYYRKSGGGLTLSGGEPFLQPEGMRELLERAKQAGLHTAVETCAAVSAERMASFAPLLDLYLIDIKHSDAEILRRQTGGSLDQMVDGLAAATARAAEKVVVRVPVIPGFNNGEAALEGIFHIALEHGVGRVHLLPYHNLGAGKYQGLGRSYPMGDAPILTKEDLLPFQRQGEKLGLQVIIGGSYSNCRK